jgi:hypothetical protein
MDGGLLDTRDPSHQELLLRIKKLEEKLDAHLADYEQLKMRYIKGSKTSTDIFELLTKRVKSHGEHLKMLYGAAWEYSQALFPERHVEGATPNLRMTLDPDKML